MQRAADFFSESADVGGRGGTDSGRGRAGVSGAAQGVEAGAAGHSCELPDQFGGGAADAAHALDPGVSRRTCARGCARGRFCGGAPRFAG